MSQRYLRVEGTTWPDPDDKAEVEWRLRYGTPTREDILTAASYLHAYRALVEMPQRQRNHRITTLRLAAPSGSPQEGRQ